MLLSGRLLIFLVWTIVQQLVSHTIHDRQHYFYQVATHNSGHSHCPHVEANFLYHHSQISELESDLTLHRVM